MCFTFLPSCFGAISSSMRYIDLGGDYNNTVMHRECFLQFVCKVSTNRRDLGSFKVGVLVPRKLQDECSGRYSQSIQGSVASECGLSFHQSASQTVRESGGTEEIVVRKRANGDITPGRNSWRDRAMIKLNFCFFFSRGWWAFLLLQLHMLQALAQGKAA